ncbi:preprotein translocase subunit SecE [Mycoplasmopsis edwardii]|uniref:Preprotein translocase subunit SecE n=1 Tax=Mycoplasmopsis edwardii TaxID=53558 RepID=A0ACD4PIF1_9BACT|nr:preprotein translocase subunit SecE [Mycoplasmopsis edwardii]WBP83763.1 preprotein translocase subunit SecE [Mycoplasmopsis edwardii]
MENKESLLTSQTNKKEKPKRVKKYWLRKVVKEIKRVRWPDFKTNKKNFIITIIFAILFTIFVSLITYGLTQLWSTLGLS